MANNLDLGFGLVAGTPVRRRGIGFKQEAVALAWEELDAGAARKLPADKRGWFYGADRREVTCAASCRHFLIGFDLLPPLNLSSQLLEADAGGFQVPLDQARDRLLVVLGLLDACSGELSVEAGQLGVETQAPDDFVHDHLLDRGVLRVLP